MLLKTFYPSNISNYRPIFLLHSVSKVFEKLVFKLSYNCILDNSTITLLQSGFVPNDSTVNQLTLLYHTFCNALDNGKELRIVFCDISKAFDRVWHNGLVAKLKFIGIQNNFLLWFNSYLIDHKQRVVLPGVESEWKYIKAGVPQGSVLGLFLFHIYVYP